MATIIGLDFGNFNSVPCFIPGFQEKNRISGEVHDLLPPTADNRFGIPSVYFYSKKTGPILGAQALKTRARPPENRLRYLKRRLYEEVTLDGRKIPMGEAITEVIQYVVREANKQLSAGWQETTNEISLAYPAGFTYEDRQYLVKLAEKATLADGRNLHVYGTIAEPAAAALDYLARENPGKADTSTVLTFDLGGGTFDLSLVAVNPSGWKRKDGSRYYYQVIGSDGLNDLGGVDFDRALLKLALIGLDKPPVSSAKTRLEQEIEGYKVDLSESESVDIEVGDEDIVTVTRKEFETVTRPMLERILLFTREFLSRYPNQQPERIVLTGGASQMPMILSAMEEAFPRYHGKIIAHKPGMAIAFGAARFGTAEPSADAADSAQAVRSVIVTTTTRDLGILCSGDVVSYIVPAGTALPYDSGYKRTATPWETDCLSYQVYEANGVNPDPKKPFEDYHQILRQDIFFGEKKPENYEVLARITLDARGLLTEYVKDAHDGHPIEVHQQAMLPQLQD